MSVMAVLVMHFVYLSQVVVLDLDYHLHPASHQYQTAKQNHVIVSLTFKHATSSLTVLHYNKIQHHTVNATHLILDSTHQNKDWEGLNPRSKYLL